MGIETVAVFAEPTAMPFVREADQAVAIDSYLDGAAIVAAAQRVGADAVHPGYGFLSENADFAELCQAAGLVWIGPPPAAMRAMASKIEARQIAAQAGVPGLSRARKSSATTAAPGSPRPSQSAIHCW